MAPVNPLPQGEGENNIPLSLYIHFPWCAKKCPYCDFNSHPLRGEVPEAEYVTALIRDLDFELDDSRFPTPDSRPLVSIFLGGGTPSLFSGAAIGRLLSAVAARLGFAPDVEITLEANPGTVDEAHFRDYRAAGVNRLSIGVQSLDAAHLKALGRIHDPDDARRAVEIARAAGFDNLNIDLMYALPRQTLREVEDDLRAALALAPEQISYYQLTLEPNTEFYAHPPPLPDGDAAWAMHENALALLAQHGYAQYEVSAHARPGFESRHNLNYWTFGDYIGIGAGAHGKSTVALASPVVVRRAKHKHPRTYLETAGTSRCLQEERRVEAKDLPFEYAMNALRLNAGFRLAAFEARTGLPASALAAPVARAQALGLLERDGKRLRATAFGRAHLNDLLQRFLP